MNDERRDRQPEQGFSSVGEDETPFGPTPAFGALASGSFVPPPQRESEAATWAFHATPEADVHAPDWDPYLLVDPSTAPEHIRAAQEQAATATEPVPAGGPSTPGGPLDGAGPASSLTPSSGTDDQRKAKIVGGAVLTLLAAAAVAIAVAHGNSASSSPASSTVTDYASTPSAVYSPSPIPEVTSTVTATPTPSVSPIPTVTSDGGHSATLTGDNVNLRSGPTTKYASIGVVNSGDSVTVLCTAYGEPIGDSGNRLWDYTTNGWIADHYVNTGTSGPTEPGCSGTVSSPSAGTVKSSAEHGPFPMLPGDGSSVQTRSQPGSSSSTVSSVSDGDMVYVLCFQAADKVNGPGGANADWDQLSDGSWVPDALVNTQMNGSPAPRC